MGSYLCRLLSCIVNNVAYPSCPDHHRSLGICLCGYVLSHTVVHAYLDIPCPTEALAETVRHQSSWYAPKSLV